MNKPTDRYLRQINVPQFGEKGQEKISKSKVLVVGAGGLGSPVIAYLGAAGVGKLGIVDSDTVDESNLQRQIIHGGKIGMNKALSAKNFIKDLNENVDVETYPFMLNYQNVKEIITEYDLVILCPDDFSTRYLVNDVCKLLKKPFIQSAIYGFEGEVMTIKDGPCYRCIFPDAPKEEDKIGNAVMGFTAGFFGCTQAAEAVKLLTGLPTLDGKYLRIDLLSMEFIVANIPEKRCPVCSGKLKGIFEENYEETCKLVRLK